MKSFSLFLFASVAFASVTMAQVKVFKGTSKYSSDYFGLYHATHFGVNRANDSGANHASDFGVNRATHSGANHATFFC